MNNRLTRRDNCLIFLPSLNEGGAEKVFCNLFNYLKLNKYTVNLVLASFHGENSYRIKNRSLLVNLKQKKVSRSIPKLLFLLLKNKPDVAISAMTHANLTLIFTCLIYKFVFRNKIKMIISERAPINFLFPKDKNIFCFATRNLIKIFYKYPDKIITVSDGIRNELSEEFGINKDKIITIMNPINSSKNIYTSDSKKPHPWFNDPIPVGISIGRLSEQKGFDILLKSIKKVNESIEYRHIICGTGKEKDKLIYLAHKLKIEDKIYFAGYVKNINLWLKFPKIFVCTSRYEGCPNVLLEALSSELPVLSTDCKYGPRELLQNGKWGELVKVDNIKEISSGIIKTLNKKELNKKELRLYLNKNYSQRYIFKKYASIIFS